MFAAWPATRAANRAASASAWAASVALPAALPTVVRRLSRTGVLGRPVQAAEPPTVVLVPSRAWATPVPVAYPRLPRSRRGARQGPGRRHELADAAHLDVATRQQHADALAVADLDPSRQDGRQRCRTGRLHDLLQPLQ